MNTEELIERLEGLRRGHLQVEEDCWYSCPKSEEGCCNEWAGPECDCGADAHNAELDAIIADLRGL